MPPTAEHGQSLCATDLKLAFSAKECEKIYLFSLSPGEAIVLIKDRSSVPDSVGGRYTFRPTGATLGDVQK